MLIFKQFRSKDKVVLLHQVSQEKHKKSSEQTLKNKLAFVLIHSKSIH